MIGYVDPAGVASQRVVAPINVRGGQLTAYDPASGRVRGFAIHRVTSVVSATGLTGPQISDTVVMPGSRAFSCESSMTFTVSGHIRQVGSP